MLIFETYDFEFLLVLILWKFRITRDWEAICMCLPWTNYWVSMKRRVAQRVCVQSRCISECVSLSLSRDEGFIGTPYPLFLLVALFRFFFSNLSLRMLKLKTVWYSSKVWWQFKSVWILLWLRLNWYRLARKQNFFMWNMHWKRENHDYPVVSNRDLYLDFFLNELIIF